MPDEATFQRTVMSGQHVIISDDLPGFIVSAPTAEEAERRFPELLARYIDIMSRREDSPKVIEHVTFRKRARG